MLSKRVALVLLTNARASCNLPKTVIRSQITILVNSFSTKSRTPEEQSFTVSYLISSCGLSPETALRASQRVHFPSADRPDSILTILRNHGFADAHISKLTKTRPSVLLSDPKKTLLPKLEFFESVGLSNADLAKIISSNPTLLDSSLKNQLIPVYNYLKSVILLDDKQVAKEYEDLLAHFRNEFGKEHCSQNCNFERIPCPCIEYISVSDSSSACTVPKSRQMMLRISKSTWEHKIEVYRKSGWSEADFRMAFKKQPLCMALSEKKITSVMDFLVNKMGWNPTAIARAPTVLFYSLQKRTIPRCLVIKVLILKGLIQKDLCLHTVLKVTDKCFVDKYVTKYEEDVPQLLDVLMEKRALLNYKLHALPA
ncbi:mitochondrial transcription termination factor family protein [Actinidia rufa]|uniref:Mitochondrial transcription termination factor family protein n=1 Tax=Actinidia rufa TaxID=165716 RepID=A0A7J0G1F6_9ERIC|nr:mitochondrial transcription termination factor family protein [Actinidia rufa]